MRNPNTSNWRARRRAHLASHGHQIRESLTLLADLEAEMDLRLHAAIERHLEEATGDNRG